MDEIDRLGKAASVVRDHEQMRKIRLCLRRVLESFNRDGHNACVAPREIFMPSFELSQLEHAEQSPPSAEERPGLCFASR